MGGPALIATMRLAGGTWMVAVLAAESFCGRLFHGCWRLWSGNALGHCSGLICPRSCPPGRERQRCVVLHASVST